jgi:LCP family protein required for cell wall assembly
MSPASPLRARPRTWPQRLVLVVGALLVVGCLGVAGATAYVGFRLGQIDRVDDLSLAAKAEDEPANYLIVGTDSREGLDPNDPDAGGFLGAEGCDCTDTIMVLRLDPEEETASILSFPRDLYLPIAGTGESARINSAHAHGVQVLIDTIQDSFGIPINHYVEVDFVGFEQIVDAVGGVPMWFDAPVRDTNTGLSVETAQCVELDGAQARRFVRSRHLEYQDEDGDWHTDPTADLGRITRQQIFVRRAIDQAVSRGLSNPKTLNDLVAAGVANVKLDEGLSAGTILSLGRTFSEFDSDELTSYSIPTAPRTTSSGDYGGELADMRAAEPYLNIFRGLPPTAVTPGSIDLTVLNGTGVDGRATDAAGALQVVGFVIEDVDTYESETVERTTAYYGPYSERMARMVARHVTGGAALVFDPDIPVGEVTLVIGHDFTTVHDQPTPEGSPEDALITTSTTEATATSEGETTTTIPSTTTTSAPGYATGEPPEGVSC